MEENTEIKNELAFAGAVKTLLGISAFITAIFLICWLFNLKVYTIVLIGGGERDFLSILAGVTYVIFYILFICLMPIFLISAGLLKLISIKAAFTEK